MQKTMLHKLSKELDMPENQIIDKSIPAFLENELRSASVDILKIKELFQVVTMQDLKQKIELGKVEEHPAWEQLIYWENLNKKIQVVTRWMRNLHITN